ncbi:unnamed protein product [Linum trigynum]|uniref:Uncharacterized protein n=1 Tax=Linum trigynum TaxID=586398 RepID=A0AAV2D826_9ROSI
MSPIRLLITSLLLLLLHNQPRPCRCDSGRRFYCLPPVPGKDNVLCSPRNQDGDSLLQNSLRLLERRLVNPMDEGFGGGGYHYCTYASYQGFTTHGYAYCRFNDTNGCRDSLTAAWNALNQECSSGSTGGQITTLGFYSCLRYEMYSFCSS